ncbi:hypothetical protein V6N11_084271 [Hibiscus sabdariffa]|uniref:Integrase catalytic domain-containing protein n=1 Tax=Hibiscus sabdariffa TaxID=183260 RepID=A0ABR2QSH7_9ROSI
MLDEAHQSSFSFHPGSIKMYKDLKSLYWWLGMKPAITDYVSRLTKSAHFIHVRVNMSSDILAEIYIREVIRLHGIPTSIVSDRDPKFMSRFWKSLQKALGTRLNLITTFHPQTDGQSERKACVDTKRRDIRYEVGDKVILKVSPRKKVLRFGKKGKLSPRYIGPFVVIEKVGFVAYQLALPPEFDKIHNVFHVSMLQRYRLDLSHMLELEVEELNLDLSYEEEPYDF